MGQRWLWAVALASILILQIGSLGFITDLSFSQEIEPQLAGGGDDPVPDLPSECIFDANNNIPDEEELADCIADGLLDNYLEQALIDAGFDGACVVDAKNFLKDAGENLDKVKFNQYMDLLKSCGPFPDSLLAFLPVHPTIMSLHALTIPSNKKLPDSMSVFMIKKGTPSTGFENCTLHGISPDCEIFASELSGGGYDTPWVHEYDHSDWAASPLGWSIFTNPSFVEENVGPDNGRTHYIARVIDPTQNTVLNKIVFPRNFHPFDPPIPIDGNTGCSQQFCFMYIDISQMFFVTYDVLNELIVKHEFYNQFAIKIDERDTPVKYQHPYPVLTLDQTILDEFRNQLNTVVTSNNEILTDQFISGLGNVRFELNCIQRPNLPQCIPASDLFDPPFDSISMDEPRRLTFRWTFVGSGEQQAPDLSIENLDVLPSSPEKGENANITFSIKNLGERAADAAKASGQTKDDVLLLLDGIQFGFVTLDYTLPSQDEVDFSFQWDTSNINIGSHELRVIIPEATPLERLLSNNERTLTVNITPPTRPDLTISEFDFAPKDPQGVIAGQSYMFRITVSNISPIDASNVKVLFGIDRSNCPSPPTMPNKIGEITINTLRGNDLKSVDFVWDTTNFAPGDYCATFVVDPSQSIPELDDNNNDLKAKGKDDIPIRVRAGSPLPCATLSTDKKIYNPGENVALNFANNCGHPINLRIELPNSDPWLVKDGSARIVFVKDPFITQPIFVDPNTIIGWGWGQIDQNLNQVRPDQYTIELQTTNAGIYTTSFTILPAQCAGKRFSSVIIGTGLNDVRIGTAAADLIVGLDGNDTLKGRGGGDCIIGGRGIDTLKGGPDNDVLIGGLDGDTVLGNAGNDIMIIHSCDFSKDGMIIDEMRGGRGTGDKLVLGIGLDLSDVNGSVPAFEVLDPCDGLYFVKSTEKIVDT